jgi:hypothetical protein
VLANLFASLEYPTTDIIVALTQKYSKVSYPLRKMSILSKAQIHPRSPHYRRGKEYRGVLGLRVNGKIELTSCLLRATSFPWIRPASFGIMASMIYLDMEGYNSTKQGCHHLHATSTNHGAIPQPKVEFSLYTTSTLSSTNSRVAQSIHLYQYSHTLEASTKQVTNN